MSHRPDAKDRRILYLLSFFNNGINEMLLFRFIKSLTLEGVQFGCTMSNEAWYSIELQKKLDRLVERGYINKFVTVGRLYTHLYITVYRITERGLKYIEKNPIPEGERKKVKNFVEQVLEKIYSKSG